MRTLLILSTILLTSFSSSALAFNTENILQAALAIHKNECSAEVHSEDPLTCSSLQEKILLLGTKDYQSAIDKLLTSMQPGCFHCANDFEDLVKNWMSASVTLAKFDSRSLLPMILCIENQKRTWQEDCQKAQTKTKDENASPLQAPAPQEFIIPFYQHGCSASLGQVSTSVEVIYDPKCNGPFLEIGKDLIGQGEYKLVYGIYEYLNWQDRAYIRFKKDIRYLPGEKQKQVLEEIRILEAILGLQLVGLPRILYVDQKRMIVEKFKEELGKGDGIIPPVGAEHWQDAASQLNAALAFIHSLGLLHNDIKPENILVSFRNQPNQRIRAVYTDFGLVTDVRSLCQKVGRMPDRQRKGTPVSMPPEIFSDTYSWQGRNCAEIEENAQKSDLFAHAVILYRMKTGMNVPWASDACLNGGIHTFAPCIQKEVPLFSAKLKASADPMDRLLGEALDLNPLKRPTTRDFQLRFDQLSKADLLSRLKDKIPYIRTDIHDSNWQEALGQEPNKALTSLRTSHTAGHFQVEIAYINATGEAVRKTLSSNPFFPEALKAEFEKTVASLKLVPSPGKSGALPGQDVELQTLPKPLPLLTPLLTPMAKIDTSKPVSRFGVLKVKPVIRPPKREEMKESAPLGDSLQNIK